LWDRRFLFTDDRLIKRLQTEFVPVVGNTHEIQNGRNAVRDWFIPVATKVKPDIAKGATAQGKYVVAADGTAYGFNNNRSVERVHQMLDKALSQFKASPPPKVEIPTSDLEATFAPEPPSGTAIVRLFTRIKPPPLGSDSSNENVARDHLWILPAEQIELAQGKLPKSLELRLLRFALVDNVRGEPDHWRVNEVKSSNFKVTKSGITVGVTGPFELSTSNNKRGFAGTLELEARFDKESKLVSMKAFAEGQAWGRSTYTPNEPPGKFPLMIAFKLVNDAQIVAPQAWFYGREYLIGS